MVPQKKINDLIHQFHFWVYRQANGKHLCSQKHYSQNPHSGTTCVSIDEWGDIQNDLYTPTGVLFRNNKGWDAATWKNPEDITLREISQTHKDKYCTTPFMWSIKMRQIQTESKTIINYNGVEEGSNEEEL